MAKDYRSYLRAVGRKPVTGKIRTTRKPGDVEMVWCPKTRQYVEHREEFDL